MDKDVKKELKERGWECVRTQGHNTVWSNGPFKVSVSSTPLSSRAVKNKLAEIRRADEAKEKGLSAEDDPRLVRGHGVKVDVEPPEKPPEAEEQEKPFNWEEQDWGKKILADQAKLEAQDEDEDDEPDKEEPMTMYQGVDPDKPFTTKELAPLIDLTNSGVQQAANKGGVTGSGFRVLKFEATPDVKKQLGGRSTYAYHAVPPDEAATWEALLEERYGVTEASKPPKEEIQPSHEGGPEAAEALIELEALREKQAGLERDNKLLRARLEGLTARLKAAQEKSSSSVDAELVALMKELVDVPEENLNGSVAKVPLTTLFKLSRALAKRDS